MRNDNLKINAALFGQAGWTSGASVESTVMLDSIEQPGAETGSARLGSAPGIGRVDLALVHDHPSVASQRTM